MTSQGVYTDVYTLHYSMRAKKRKSRRQVRKTILFNLWLQPIEKQKLEQLSATTGLDQSKLVRRGLAMLFDAFNRGQLELGFPETVRESRT